MSIGQLPQSFRGYVGLAKESTFGSNPTPDFFVDAMSDGFTLDNQPDFQNTTRSRATHKGETGAFVDEGSLDLPANPENGLGLLLKAAFGNEVLTTSDPDGDSTAEVGNHFFTLNDDPIPSLSVEVDTDRDAGGGFRRHSGVGVDTLELSHTSEEMLTASVDLVAKEPEGLGAIGVPYQVTPVYSDLRNFRWHDISLSVGGVTRDTDVQDATFRIENGLGSEYRGERTLSKLSLGERVLSATMTLDFENNDLIDAFIGDGSADRVQEQMSNIGVEATWTSPETIADVSTQYALQWEMPKCTVNTHEANINQNDAVVEDVELRALYDPNISAGSSTTAGEAVVKLTNGITQEY